MFCEECGKELADDARFCDNCGTPVRKDAEEVGQEEQLQDGKPQEGLARKVALGVAEELRRKAEDAAAQIAPGQPGEVMLGTFGDAASVLSQGMTAAVAPIMEIVNPFKTLFREMKSLVQGLVGMIKNKRWLKLIFAILLAVVWIVLMVLQYNENEIGVLNWITFAQGGVGRSIPGWLGGLLGKTTVAAMLFTLFGGGFRSLGSGIKSLFRGTNFKNKNLGSLLIGVGFALIAYQAFAGETSLTDTMSAISGALLSVMALGRGGGFFWNMAQSLTAKKMGGKRLAQKEKIQGMLSGVTFGFALGAAITFIPFGWLSVILGGVSLVAGIILSILFGRKKEVATV